MKCIFIFLIISMFAFDIQAHDGSIKGKVLDEKNQTELTGANVYITELNKGTITDAFGMYTFNNIPAGEYELKVSYIGYESYIFNVLVNSEQTVTTAPIYMKGSTLNLSEVVATSNNKIVNTIGAVDIKLRPITSSQDVLRIVPGLFIAQHAGGGKAEQIFLRGFDIDHGTDISISVDGLPVNMVSHAHGQGYADLHFLIPETIDKVDYTKGPYEAQYGNFTTAGRVAFQTKDELNTNLVKAERGLFNTYRTVALINLLNNENRQNAYIAGEYMFTDGPFVSSQHFKRINLFAKYKNRVSDSKIFEASISTFSKQLGCFRPGPSKSS